MTETNEKLDPRIARTRSLLWATLVALIKKRGYAAISVQDITTHARVNRSTFYRHYEDKDDLFRQGCSDLYDAHPDAFQDLLRLGYTVQKVALDLLEVPGCRSETWEPVQEKCTRGRRPSAVGSATACQSGRE